MFIQTRTVYSRIVEVDVDGQKIYTQIASIQISQQQASLLIAPNPAGNLLNLLVNNASGQAIISVYDMAGRKLMEQYSQISQGTIFPLNISDFVPGSCVVRIRINSAILQLPSELCRAT
jgi:Secretion system C-terminal sorting domain